MEGGQSDDPRARRANELYWESEESVNRIADELDVSKGALYGMVRPLPASLPCPRCSAELEYPNRTARERGLVACPACGLEEEEDEVRGEWEEAAAGSPDGALVVTPGSGVERPGGGPVGRGPETRVVAGAVLLGAAVGFALGSLLGRRN